MSAEDCEDPRHVPVGKLTSQPPPYYDREAKSPAQYDRIQALKLAINVIGDRRTIEELLQAAHWIYTGQIVTIEEGDTHEDNN